MQDNAPIRKASNWLVNHEIPVLEWPSYSPDLNPIEYVWAMPKKMLLERYPRLIEIGKSAQAIEQFKEAIREYWRLLDQDKIDWIVSVTG